MRKSKKITAIGLAFVMAVTSGVFGCTKSPKEKVMDAFVSSATASSSDALSKELGISDVLESVKKGSSKAGLELTLEDTDMYELAGLVSASVSSEASYDAKDKKMLMELGIGYAASDIISCLIYADEEQIALQVPELLEEVLYINYSGNLAKKLKNSAIVKMSGIAEEDIDTFLDSLGSTQSDEVTEFLLGFETETKAVSTFKDAIEVEEIGTEKFTINGKEQKCDGYEVVITEESIADLAEEIIDYFLLSKDAKSIYESILSEASSGEMGSDIEYAAEDLEEMLDTIKANKKDFLSIIKEVISDIKLEMYLCKGQIVSLEAEVKITEPGGSEENKVGVEFVATGGDYGLYDNYELAVKVMKMNIVNITKETNNSKSDYEVVYEVGGIAMQDVDLHFEYALDKKNGDFEAKAVLDDGYDDIRITLEGVLEVEKKSMTMELDKLLLTVDSEVVFELSGKYFIESDAADVKMPKGTKFDILTEKESDWEDLIGKLEDIENKIYKLIGSIY